MPESSSPQRGAISQRDDVKSMFDRISGRYDVMNHLMTGGLDIHWRSMVAKQATTLPDRASTSALDLATGTGDLAFSLHKAGIPEVVGTDISTGMIDKAIEKATSRKSPVHFQVADAMDLPFDDATFDVCTIGFGLRNMPDYAAAVKEMARVLKPGGKLICLEMTPFRRPFIGVAYRFYFEGILPLIGGLVAGNYKAYKYLPTSVRNFPNADALADLFRDAGLDDVTYQLLGLGAVAIHSGVKPAP